MKYMMTKIAAGLALAAAATGAQAVAVTSMTVEEIGVVSGGFSNSAVSLSTTPGLGGGTGGIFFFGAAGLIADGGITDGNVTGKSWGTTGSTAGAIISGAVQNNSTGSGGTVGNDFTQGFTYGGSPVAIFKFNPNSSNGALTLGTTAGELNLSGFGGFWNAGGQFALFPDAGTVALATQQIGSSNQYYYTLDFAHTITAAENVDFAGQRADWHLEGVMTAAVPEASTYGMMLAGLGLVGFAVRRRKLA